MNLLERGPTLAQLDGLLRRAAAGQGHLVFLGGEAGIGKSVVVERFCHDVAGEARVLLGACDSLSTPRPLGPLADIAAAIGGELEHAVAADGQRHRAFRSFLEVLDANDRTSASAGRVSRGTPTVAVFEDVHWADEATLDLIRFLARRIAGVSGLLIATYRDDEIGGTHPLRTVLGDVATSPAVVRMTLRPLSLEAVTQLAEGSGLDPVEVHRKTGGNPFFVTEVIAAAADAAGSPGAPVPADATDTVPTTVRDAVLARAARLSPRGRAALDACAVIGFRVDVRLLGDVLGEAGGPAEEGIGLGMLRAVPGPRGSTLTFRHELARVALLEALSPASQVDLHGRVLAALERLAPDDLSTLAHHAEGAADGAAVLAYAPPAARRASAVGAHREAAAQYARTLRFASDMSPAERARLLAEYAWECHLTGQDDAITARNEAIAIWRELGDRHAESENLARLAHAYIVRGRNAEAEAAGRRAIEILEGLPPSPELALAYRYQSYLRMLDRDNDEAVAWGQRAIEVAQAFDERETMVHAYNAIGSAWMVSGEVERGREALEQSLRLAQEANLEFHVANAYSNLGSGSGEIYRFDVADPYLAKAATFSEEHDLVYNADYARAWQALSATYQGRWDEAVGLARGVLARPSIPAIGRITALIALGRVRARRGDPEVATLLDEALGLARRTGTLQRLGPVQAARAEAAWLRGDLGATRSEARAAYDLALGKRHAWFAGELAYWRWKAGDLTSAPDGIAEPYALQIGGDARGAAEAWTRSRCPYEAARALAEADDEDALRSALTTFEELGARPAASFVAARMRELGFGGIPRGPRRSTRDNAAMLTRRQMEVLRLMADGLSNVEIAARLIRSPKTVEHHVSAILAKLEARNRVEAVREATRLGLLDGAE
jgi:DNA-binding CsgD family transcriptional regulator/tetratricopeptide (TPR) repeat protein